jgi:hypothetical protein
VKGCVNEEPALTVVTGDAGGIVSVVGGTHVFVEPLLLPLLLPPLLLPPLLLPPLLAPELLELELPLLPLPDEASSRLTPPLPLPLDSVASPPPSLPPPPAAPAPPPDPHAAPSAAATRTEPSIHDDTCGVFIRFPPAG